MRARKQDIGQYLVLSHQSAENHGQRGQKGKRQSDATGEVGRRTIDPVGLKGAMVRGMHAGMKA